MPRNRKYFVNQTVLFVTARTEEGLPLVPSYLMNFFIEGILARAQALYRIKVCHYLFMSNHFHMILVVENPEHVSAFVGYVKGETAHVINRLLGQRRKTVWVDGYDSPVILTFEDVLRYIEYLYVNPAKANLVETIDNYPGVSSWKMFTGKHRQKKCTRIPRSEILPLPKPSLSLDEQFALIEYYRELSQTSEMLVIEPNAWLECFPETKGEDPTRLKKELLERIHETETEFAQERTASNKVVIGANRLRQESMRVEYSPKKFSKRMICISSCHDLRRRFIEHFRYVCLVAQEAYSSWRRGDFSAKLPPGLFAPALPRVANISELVL